MKSHMICYVSIYEARNRVFATGIPFSDFIEGIPVKPENLLLMSSYFYNGKLEKNTGFEYVDRPLFEQLSADDIAGYGNFSWVDFENVADLEEVTEVEISEMLYADYRGKALKSPFFDSVRNRYMYLAHDDDWMCTLYMRTVRDYRYVIAQRLQREIMGRRKTIAPIPDEILNVLFDYAARGVVFDFSAAGENLIGIWEVGNYDDFHYDIMHKEFDRLNERHLDKKLNTLEYSPRSKKWKLWNAVPAK